MCIRDSYTIIGDGVNLSARLESACKQYGAHILISEFTYKALKGTYFSRELDLVVVKGKTKPVSYTHLRAHETVLALVCRHLLEKKKKNTADLRQCADAQNRPAPGIATVPRPAPC